MENLSDGRVIDLAKFRVVELCQQDKNALLGLNSHEQESVSVETGELLSNLQKLYPPASNEFVYKTPLQYPTPFRLLLGCSKKDLSPTNTYIAISYCWHNDYWQCPEGYVSRYEAGREWPFCTRILKYAMGLRQDNEGIWIDQLSIDQNNEEEKQLAIGSMDTIYKKARLVVAPLQDILLTKEEAELLERLQMHGPNMRDENLDAQQIIQLQKAVEKVFSARWFTRAWCVHECLLAYPIKLLVPSEQHIVETDIENLEGFAELVNINETDDEYSTLTQVIDRVLPLISRKSELDSMKLGDSTLRASVSMFNDILKLSCFDPTDKISIAINGSGILLRYCGAKKENDSVQWLLSMLALAAGDMSVLCGVEELIIGPVQIWQEPWLQYNDDVHSKSLLAPPLVSLDAVKFINPSKLVANFLDVSSLTYNSASNNSLKHARQFVQFCLSDEYLRTKMVGSYFPTNNSEGNIYSAGEEFLACSLDCGIEWMAEQGVLRCQSEGSYDPVDWFERVTEKDISDPIRSKLLASKQRVEVDSSQSLKDGICKYVAASLFFGLESLYHGDIALVSRQFGQYSTYGERWCAWTEIYPGEKAIVYPFNAGFVNEQMNMKLALPLMLCHQRWSTTRRLWVLDNAESRIPGAWNIIAKLGLITYRDIKVGDMVSNTIHEVEICGRKLALMHSDLRLADLLKSFLVHLDSIRIAGNSTAELVSLIQTTINDAVKFAQSAPLPPDTVMMLENLVVHLEHEAPTLNILNVRFEYQLGNFAQKAPLSQDEQGLVARIRTELRNKFLLYIQTKRTIDFVLGLSKIQRSE